MTVSMGLFKKNVVGLFFGQASRLAIQAAYFIVLARMLGASDYGAFASALALAALAVPFSSIGTNTLMVKNVSRDHDTAAREWRRAILVTVLGGICLSLALISVSDFILPDEVSRWAFFQIALAELIGLKVVELVGLLWQAMGRSMPLIVLPNLLNLLRLGAALAVFLLWESTSLEQWANIYVWSAMPLSLLVAIHTTIRLGRPHSKFTLSSGELREGLLYSVSMASQNVHNDIDKAMLARLDSASSAGVYSAAYRIIDMAYSPIRAIATAAYPLYFREGEKGLAGALALTKKLAPVVILVALLGGASALFVAPFAPYLLGSDFFGAVEVIRLLAVLVLLRGLTFLASDPLTGSGLQGFRTAVQIAVAILNVVLNIVLIPLLGILGAVISTLVCETVLASILWSRIVFAHQRHKAPATSSGKLASELATHEDAT